jgi:biotin transport system ATP-binding protein
VIVLEGVTHRFGERIVLREVSVTLPEPRVGIVGDNGSGKSTLARMLNGLVVPTTGRVVVDGLDTRRHGREVRRKVGFVFTDPDAQIVMPTVVEDVAFGLRRSGLPRSEVRARVHAALTTYGLEDHADHPAHLLSGGEKQLLALAAVLVTEPALLVCDEPTTLLDRRNARRVVALLHGLPQQVVLVTHHLDLLAGFERVLVLEDGRLVDDGPPDPVLAAYRDRVG